MRTDSTGLAAKHAMIKEDGIWPSDADMLHVRENMETQYGYQRRKGTGSGSTRDSWDKGLYGGKKR